MAKEEKKRITQENIRRVKEAGVKPWRMALSIIFFVFTIIMLPKIFEQGVGPLDSFAWFYLAMALVATLIDVIQGNVHFRIGLIISTFFGYMFRMFLEVALIILSIPVIILVFFLGPFMIIIFFVSAVILGVYFIESVLGIDIKGVSAPLDGISLIMFVVGLIVSFFAILRLDKLDNIFDFFIDKIVDILLYIEKVWAT